MSVPSVFLTETPCCHKFPQITMPANLNLSTKCAQTACLTLRRTFSVSHVVLSRQPQVQLFSTLGVPLTMHSSRSIILFASQDREKDSSKISERVERPPPQASDSTSGTPARIRQNHLWIPLEGSFGKLDITGLPHRKCFFLAFKKFRT